MSHTAPLAPHHKLAKWAGIFLLVGVPFAYAHDGIDIVLYAKLLVAQIGALLMAVAWLVGTLKGDISQRRHPLDLPILLFLLIYVLSWSAMAINPFQSGLVVVKLFTFIALYFATSRTCHVSFLKPWVYTITLVAACVSILGICQYFALGFLSLRTGGLPSATLVMRNLAAMYLICVIPISILPFLWASNIRSELIWGGLFTLPTLFLIYTRARGAWLGLSMAIILSIILTVIQKHKTVQSGVHAPTITLFGHPLWLATKSKPYISALYVILIISAATLPPISPPNINYVMSASKTEVSQTALSIIHDTENPRFIQWKHTLRMIQDHWLFGVGVGNWQLLYPQYERGEYTRPDYYAQRPHNDALWITAELGILGILLFLFIWGKTLFILFFKPSPIAQNLSPPHTPAVPSRLPPNDTPLILTSFGISLLAISGHACFSFPYERIPPLLFWGLIMGITSVTSPISQPKQRLAKYTYIPTILNILCLIFSIIFTHRAIQADKHFYALTKYRLQNNWAKVEQTATQSLKYGVINHWVLFWYAHATHRQGDLPSALRAFKNCLSYHPNSQIVYWKIGLLEQSLGHLDKAQIALERAVFLDNDNHGYHQDLGAVYQLQGKYKDALDAYQSAKHLGAYNIQLYLNMAEIYEVWGQNEKAIQTYTQFLNSWQGNTTTTDLIQAKLQKLQPPQ